MYLEKHTLSLGYIFYPIQCICKEHVPAKFSMTLPGTQDADWNWLKMRVSSQFQSCVNVIDKTLCCSSTATAELTLREKGRGRESRKQGERKTEIRKIENNRLTEQDT